MVLICPCLIVPILNRGAGERTCIDTPAACAGVWNTSSRYQLIESCDSCRRIVKFNHCL